MGSQSGLSLLIISASVILYIIAFGLAVGAESRRSHVAVKNDRTTSYTYCSYSKDVATGLGVGAFFFLLFAQVVVMGLTRCLCGSNPLKPGGARVFAIICFIFSWLSFIISAGCLVAGATKAAYRTKSAGYEGAFDLNCETLRKGIFSAAAAFIFFTMLLSEVYYLCLAKAQEASWQAPYGGPSVGMASYSR